ncbi:MAG: UvrD-helicase domain-containing protein [Bdellovibrionota bacterium]
MALREIVEAGAGCGKTTGLVDRYVAALGLHKDPALKALYAPQTRRLPHAREILALTFTNEAARQMQERILKRLNADGFVLEARAVREDSQISTYHSFCLRTLQPYLAARGFDGTLLTPTLAAYLRREYLLRALAEYPEADAVRKALRLPEILSLGTRLWFRPLGSSPASELRETYETLEEHFEAFRSDLLARAENAMDIVAINEKKPSPEGWLPMLIEALKTPSNEAFAKVNFTRGPKSLKQNYPDIAEDAGELREFFKRGLASFLDPKLRRDELEAQEALWTFLNWARPRAPKIFDFEAAEQELLKLLRESALGSIVPPPRVILVDEFQDTNAVQYEILQLISDDDTEWYFVGDPKQSIYAFRGGDVSLFYKLKEELKLKSLDTNYRSGTRILELVNRLQPTLFRAQENPNDPDPQILKWPEGKSAGEVSMHWLASSDSTLEYAAKLIAENPKRFTQTSSAVLFRTWDKLYKFSSLLSSHGIEYRIAGSENAFDHILTDIFCNYLVSIENPGSPEGFWAVERWKKPRSFAWNALPAAEDIQTMHVISEKSWSSSFQRFCEEIDVKRFEGAENWVSAMERWLSSSVSEGLASRMTRVQLALWIRKNSNNIDVENPYRITPDDAEKPGLTLLTLHSSKGLEFGHVYLPELFERAPPQRDESLESEDGELMMKLSMKKQRGHAPRSLAFEIRKATQSLSQHSEQKRLLYVALTRAIEGLHIIGHHSAYDAAKKHPNPLRVVGAFKPHPEYWHHALQALDISNVADSHEVDPKAAAPETDTSLPWNYPYPPESRSASQEAVAYQRCGVSSYLKLQDARSGATEENANTERHRASSFDFAHQNDVGTDFHALLEMWDGSDARLGVLTKNLDLRLGRMITQAAQSLRKLPELADYWEALQKNPERVQREFGVFLISPEYRLSGFADVVWFRSRDELCLIDWKSSSSLKKLSSPERLEKFRRQLELYASGFSGCFPKIRIEVYGIGLGERVDVAQVLSENVFISS